MGEPPLLVICGPTATGKTAASVVVAERIGGEIVCADSRTIYRGMDIGTAKPTAAQRARVPHHLLDIADPGDVVTLADFRMQALAAVAGIRARRRRPILVGGTGLFIRAVVDGFTIPPVPPDAALRARLEDLEQRSPGILHQRLRAADPAAAGRIHPRNVRRLVRALEVFEHTGRPISDLQRRYDPVGPAIQSGLTMDRAALYRQIDARVDAQIAAGLVDEVRALLARGHTPPQPAMQGLGYKEIAEFLQGTVPLDEAIRRLKRNTRRFAKRQLTWFCRDDRVRWLDVNNWTPEQVADAIVKMIE